MYVNFIGYSYTAYANKKKKENASYAQAVTPFCFLAVYASWPHTSATIPATTPLEWEIKQIFPPLKKKS